MSDISLNNIEPIFFIRNVFYKEATKIIEAVNDFDS